MENQQTQKQWWAPVWKGLVVDADAKHYRLMKNAVWLYLYLLVNANRRTGILMRRIETVSNDMGVTRDAVLRWFKVLRQGSYIETINTGRSLTIQVTRWKAIAGVGKTLLQKTDISNSRYGNYPNARQLALPTNPPRIGTIPSLVAASNETKMQINIINEIARGPTQGGFARIGVGIQQELLAQKLAQKLNDAAGINLYRSYAAKHPEWLLRKVLVEVEAVPAERITKGRGALFNYLVQYHAKRITENPGN